MSRDFSKFYLPLLEWIILLFAEKLELLEHFSTRIQQAKSSNVIKICAAMKSLFSLSSSDMK